MGGKPSGTGLLEAIASYGRIRPVAPQRVPLFEAAGLRLAEDVVVKRPAPLEPLAARDGWAVAAADTTGAARRRPKPLPANAALLDAGSVMPKGTDAVLTLDAVAQRARGPVVLKTATPGEGVVVPEGLAPAGAVLAAAGTRVTFAVAIAFAQCGITDVLVRRPVVDIIFNSPGLTRSQDQWAGVIGAAIQGSGCKIGSIQFTAGDQALLAETLLNSSADIITIVGGTGGGPGDVTMQAIASVGEVVFHGVRLSPGGSTGFGLVGERPIFASPGCRAGMMAANIVLSWHFARRAFGRPPKAPQLQRARLTEGLPAPRGESRLIFARHEDGVIAPLFDPAPSSIVMARMNASILQLEGSRHLRRGEFVDFLQFGVSM